MSQRRRLFVVAVVLFTVALAAAAVVQSTRGHGTHRPVPPQGVPGPVLLVPGYGGGIAGVERLAERIRATGRPATVVGLPAGGTGDLRTQAEVLNTLVDAALTAGAPSVDVIGQSADTSPDSRH
jgi:triacylglycerol esterase/lipase EstA (alpha/beta hydrolase family)